MREDSRRSPATKVDRAVVDVLFVCNLIKLQDFSDEAVGGGPSPRDELLLVSPFQRMLRVWDLRSSWRRYNIHTVVHDVVCMLPDTHSSRS